MELKIEDIPLYQPRRFVPVGADLSNPKQVEELFKILLLQSIQSPSDLEQWLLDLSEIEAALSQEESLLYIRMTCQTDDQTKAEQYAHFIEHVQPISKYFEDKFNLKYLEERKRFSLEAERYEVFDRAVHSDVELFREDNIPLQTKESLLSQEYQAICGAMSVSFEGKELTLPEMTKYLLEPDRSLRQKAWAAIAERRLNERQRLDVLFDEMLQIRSQIAQNAGYKNYQDYQFKNFHRFEYTPQDCRAYHAAIEKYVLPLWRTILERRRQEMKLERLRPWDLQVDPLGRPPLKPFKDVQHFVNGVAEMIHRTDPVLGEQFQKMSSLGLLDLLSYKGKAPGGYQSTLAEIRKPFIFMNSVGTDDDIRTLLHESGHAFHVLACAHQPLHGYRHGPMEFNEVASMSMELIGGESISVFYSPEDEKRSRHNHLEDIIYTLIWVATVDCFQDWIYSNPKHASEERNRQWLSIYRQFGADLIDWTGLKEVQENLWHRQLHIFEVPFYYIEYGIAQLGALQLWWNYKKDKKTTLAAYQKALGLGGSRPLPELFKIAGLNFDFSEKTIHPLIEHIREELKPA